MACVKRNHRVILNHDLSELFGIQTSQELARQSPKLNLFVRSNEDKTTKSNDNDNDNDNDNHQQCLLIILDT